MKQTKTARLLDLLSREWVTPLLALHHCQLLSLSQRVTSFERAGHTIARRWVTTSGGSRVMAYRLIKRAK